MTPFISFIRLISTKNFMIIQNLYLAKGWKKKVDVD